MTGADYRAIRLMAMADAVQPDEAGLLRKIFRNYSKTFHTPLHIVECLPLEDVLLAYFTEIYEEMQPPERLRERVLLLESPEEREERETREEEEDAEDEAFLQQIHEDEVKEKEQARHERIISEVRESKLVVPDQLSKAFESLNNLFQGIPDIQDIGETDLAQLSDEELAFDHAPNRR